MANRRRWVCSYCGKKLDADEDQMVDKRWARFVVELGRGECNDTRTRVSCPEQVCRAHMHEDLREAIGGKASEKVDFLVEAKE